MPNILDTVQISGSSYDLKDKNAPSVSAVTQQEYDNLPSSAKTSNTFFVISDAQAGDLSQYWTSAQTNSAITQATSGKVDTTTYNTYTAATDTALDGKQATLVSGTNIKTINNESILGSGNIEIESGGKAVTGGTNISVTTGETADTINCTLNLVNGGGTNSVKMKNTHSSNGSDSFAIGTGGVKASGLSSFAGGSYSEARGIFSMAFGRYSITNNYGEVALGFFGKSNGSSNAPSQSGGNTLFSVGNGTNGYGGQHNAFEIRQNGDIYLTKDGQDVKLQDQLGGGGSTYTAGDGIDITNNVISVTGKADTSAVTAIQDSLSGYVTTDTEQIISGRKIFTYTSGSSKAIEFKQTSDSAKVGFRIINSAATNNEVASFEFRPNTFTIDDVQHPLMYFGHYRNNGTANAGVPQTVIGFRQYDQKNAAAYHYLLPLPEKAKTPFSLTTSFKDYYAPMGFKNGSTMITADNTGVVDLSSELDGLKLKKLTQSEYDALATKDSNVLYVIVG